MRRRSRTRRVLKWVGLAVCLVVLAAWAISTWRRVGYWRNKYEFREAEGQYYVYVSGGVLSFGCENIGHPPGFCIEAAMRGAGLIGPAWVRFKGMTIIVVPLWLLLTTSAIPTALLWYRDRRLPKGHCQDCGYDLTGNESGICPECGQST